MPAEGTEKALRRLHLGMGLVTLAALASLVLEHGMLVGRPLSDLLHVANLACLLLFAGLQAAKLLVVSDPRSYFRRHWIDFSLLLVVAVQTVAYLALRETPEHRYLVEHGHPSILWAFYIATIQVYFLAIVVLRSPMVHTYMVQIRMRPAQILVGTFLLMILIGAFALALPGAAARGRSIGFVDALFTATSAVCVTGLTVRDTGTELARTGLVLLLGLIQAGGLGMLTITASFAYWSGRGLTREEGRAVAEALAIDEAGRIRRVLGSILLTTLLLESAGAAALYFLWADAIPDLMARVFWAFFHSVSAFCNAGFALSPQGASLTGHATDLPTLAVLAALIVAGGLGFVVLAELGARLVAPLRGHRPPPLSLQGRWALAATALLLASGAVLFHRLEGEGLLRASGTGGGWVHAVFLSVSLRTAGFHTLDLAGLGAGGAGFCIVWMLIGGSPGGTAGGVKTTSLVAAIGAFTSRAGIDPATAARSLRLLGAYALFFLLSAVSMALLTGEWGRSMLFETASALGTVGLSMGATSTLGSPEKLLLCLVMFVGRVGPFALATALLSRKGEGVGSSVRSSGPSGEGEPARGRLLIG